jgi:DNA-binding NtrC family response regulator
MKIDKNPSSLLEGILGNSPEIVRIRKTIAALAPGHQHVLVVGDPGTEKNQAAQLLYEMGDVQSLLINTNAVRLNAAFDHEVKVALKKAAAANDSSRRAAGVLIVEDVEQLNAEAQKKLSLFAHRGFYTASAKEEPIETDFRLITTCSSQWLLDDNKEGFDSDLFLVISEVMIKIPSLRDRRQDIPLMFENYLNRVCKDLERTVPAINFEVFNQMLKYDWPGNAKELTNVVRTLVIASPDNELVPQALPFYNQKNQINKFELHSLGIAVANLEKEMIEFALTRFAGNQSRAAQVLNISEANLRWKMKKIGLQKKDFTPKG